MEPLSDQLQIIALAPNAWHGQWVNRQQLLSRLGAQHSVLYSTGAWSVWDRDSAAWRSAAVLGGVTQSDRVSVEVATKMLLRCLR